MIRCALHHIKVLTHANDRRFTNTPVHVPRITTIGLFTWLTIMAAPACAMEVVGDRLEIFGVFHASVDYMDSDVDRATADADKNDRLVAGDLGISSNVSRIGFKGRHRTDSGITALFELGQTVHLDGASGDTFTSRNSYVGLAGERWGEVLLGRHDTPFKIVGSDYTLFKDTVADLGGLLGSGADASGRPGEIRERFTNDLRAENMILWRNGATPARGRVEWMIQYSPDAVKSGGNVDNNDRSMWGLGVQWETDTFRIAAGYDHWSQLYGGRIDAARLGAAKRFGAITIGMMYESVEHELETGGVSHLDRDAYGVNVAVEHRSWHYLTQVLAADDYGNTQNTGAVMFAAGVEKRFDATLKSYLIYTRTDNEENAAFPGVGGTHGDRLATLPGRTPRALSFGVRYSF